jgi:tetratricopeptide (TPR) repeat protein
VLLTLLLFALSLWSLKRRKIFFFAFFFFVVTILPFLNLVPSSTILADRYVFLASFSYCFLLGVGFDRLYTLRLPGRSEGFFPLLSVSLFLFLLTGYSLMTLRQNRIWENSYTLWADAVEKSPESNTANALMGVVYMDLAMDQEAIKYLEKAVEILPYDYQSLNNLGIVYGRSGMPERGEQALFQALSLRPDDENILINLSVVYQSHQAYDRAEAILKALLSVRPKDPNLHFRLGWLYREMGRYEETVAEWIRSSEIDPNPGTFEALGTLYLTRLNDPEKAKHYYTEGVKTGKPGSPRAEQLRWMIQDLEAR